MFTSRQDRLRDIAIEKGGIIQAPLGSGKHILIRLYRCLVDGDSIIENHYGVDLRVSLTLLPPDKSSQEIIRDKFAEHIRAGKIILTSIRPEMLGLLCNARYTYHPCQYPDLLEAKGIKLNVKRDELISQALSYDKDRTYYMEMNENLTDYLVVPLQKQRRCVPENETNPTEEKKEKISD